MYTKPLGNLIKKHDLAYHMYADDTQIYLSFSPKDISDKVNNIRKLEMCLFDIQKWMVRLITSNPEMQAAQKHSARQCNPVRSPIKSSLCSM